MGREGLSHGQQGRMVVAISDTGNNGESPGGGKQGQLMSSRSKVMESINCL